MYFMMLVVGHNRFFRAIIRRTLVLLRKKYWNRVVTKVIQLTNIDKNKQHIQYHSLRLEKIAIA